MHRAVDQLLQQVALPANAELSEDSEEDEDTEESDVYIYLKTDNRYFVSVSKMWVTCSLQLYCVCLGSSVEALLDCSQCS